PAAALLVGDLPVVQQRGHEVVGVVDNLPVDGHVVHGHLGHRVLRQRYAGFAEKSLPSSSRSPALRPALGRTPPTRPRHIRRRPPGSGGTRIRWPPRAPPPARATDSTPPRPARTRSAVPARTRPTRARRAGSRCPTRCRGPPASGARPPPRSHRPPGSPESSRARPRSPRHPRAGKAPPTGSGG